MGTTCGAPSAPAVARWPMRCASRKRRVSAVQLGIADLLAQVLGVRLRDDLAVASLVARREVEDVQPPRTRGAGERAGLPRRQVIAPRRLIDVLVEERRLAVEEVRVGGEADDAGGVRRREERVDDVGDLLPRRHVEEGRAQLAERPAIAGRDLEEQVLAL